MLRRLTPVPYGTLTIKERVHGQNLRTTPMSLANGYAEDYKKTFYHPSMLTEANLSNRARIQVLCQAFVYRSTFKAIFEHEGSAESFLRDNNSEHAKYFVAVMRGILKLTKAQVIGFTKAIQNLSQDDFNAVAPNLTSSKLPKNTLDVPVVKRLQDAFVEPNNTPDQQQRRATSVVRNEESEEEEEVREAEVYIPDADVIARAITKLLDVLGEALPRPVNIDFSLEGVPAAYRNLQSRLCSRPRDAFEYILDVTAPVDFQGRSRKSLIESELKAHKEGIFKNVFRLFFPDFHAALLQGSKQELVDNYNERFEREKAAGRQKLPDQITDLAKDQIRDVELREKVLGFIASDERHRRVAPADALLGTAIEPWRYIIRFAAEALHLGTPVIREADANGSSAGYAASQEIIKTKAHLVPTVMKWLKAVSGSYTMGLYLPTDSKAGAFLSVVLTHAWHTERSHEKGSRQATLTAKFRESLQYSYDVAEAMAVRVSGCLAAFESFMNHTQGIKEAEDLKDELLQRFSQSGMATVAGLKKVLTTAGLDGILKMALFAGIEHETLKTVKTADVAADTRNSLAIAQELDARLDETGAALDAVLRGRGEADQNSNSFKNYLAKLTNTKTVSGTLVATGGSGSKWSLAPSSFSCFGHLNAEFSRNELLQDAVHTRWEQVKKIQNSITVSRMELDVVEVAVSQDAAVSTKVARTSKGAAGSSAGAATSGAKKVKKEEGDATPNACIYHDRNGDCTDQSKVSHSSEQCWLHKHKLFALYTKRGYEPNMEEINKYDRKHGDLTKPQATAKMREVKEAFLKAQKTTLGRRARSGNN